MTKTKYRKMLDPETRRRMQISPIIPALKLMYSAT